ncbi:MAG: hypothetical protein WCY56_00500 [Aminobacteriaceae bacterium]
MPILLERVRSIFHPVEMRQGAPLPKIPGHLPFVKEMSGHPRFCGSIMGAEALWDMDVLEKQGTRPHDVDFTADYRVAGKSVRVLGRHHRYLAYPVNVFLNVCMMYDGKIEIVDFCLNLLAEVAAVNWFGLGLPREMHYTPLGGKDSYQFDRNNQMITLDIPTVVFKRLPLSLTSSAGSVGRVSFELVPGESFFRDTDKD